MGNAYLRGDRWRRPTNSSGIPRASARCVPQPEDCQRGEDIRERAFRFSCRVVKFCQRLYEIGGLARAMAPQLLNAGTALYPMLEEARAAESTRDFISKCNIGLKEIREAHGRLRVHETCEIGPVDQATAL